MKRLAAVATLVFFSALPMTAYADGSAASQDQAPSAIKGPETVQPEPPTVSAQAPVSQTNPDAITLTAQKVDPKEAAQASPAPAATSPAIKKKKPLPIFLQPIEFVVSAVVHTITFWDKGDS